MAPYSQPLLNTEYVHSVPASQLLQIPARPSEFESTFPSHMMLFNSIHQMQIQPTSVTHDQQEFYDKAVHLAATQQQHQQMQYHQFLRQSFPVQSQPPKG